MSDFDQNSECTGDEPHFGALVPVIPTVQFLPPHAVNRPDPTFVTHMMADADPVTPTLSRRTAYADAKAAYVPGPQERRGVIRRTRQVI